MIPNFEGDVRSRGVSHLKANLIVKLKISRADIPNEDILRAKNRRGGLRPERAARPVHRLGGIPARVDSSGSRRPTVQAGRKTGDHRMVRIFLDVRRHTGNRRRRLAAVVVEQKIDRVFHELAHRSVPASSGRPVIDVAHIPPIHHASRVVSGLQCRSLPSDADDFVGVTGFNRPPLTGTEIHAGEITRKKRVQRASSQRVEIRFNRIRVHPRRRSGIARRSDLEPLGIRSYSRRRYGVDHAIHVFHAADEPFGARARVVPVIVPQNEKSSAAGKITLINVDVSLRDGVPLNLSRKGSGHRILVGKAKIEDNAIVGSRHR